MENLKCSKPDCSVNKNGLCHDGISPPTDCPHIILSGLPEVLPDENTPELRIEQRSTDAIQQPTLAVVSGESIALGRELSAREASNLAAEKQSQIIVLIGMLNCGKTTLIAELFLSFLDGPVGDLFFAGSQTLEALDHRCHKARLQSGNLTPHTQRTPLEESFEKPYIHLDVCRARGKGDFHRLLIVDLSGEYYERAASSDSETASLPGLTHAVHIVAILDGAKLCNPRERETEKSTMLRLLQRIMAAGFLNSKVVLEVVVTKWDDVIASQERTDAEQFISGIEIELEKTYINHVGGFRLHHVAARPMDGITKNRLGLSELLESWCPEPVQRVPDLSAYPAISDRQVSSFTADSTGAS